MNHRPINSLTEDFAALGLVENNEESLDEMNPNQLAADFAKRMKKRGGKTISPKKPGKPGMDAAEDFDFDLEDEVEEGIKIVRRKKLRGAGVGKMHHDAKVYAATHKNQRKIAANRPEAKRHRAILAKKPKARKGFARVQSDVDLGNLGGTIQALGEATNTVALQQAFTNLYRFGRKLSEGYQGLIEQDYVSQHVSYPTMKESSALMAKEAYSFAKALVAHDEFLSVADQGLLQDHAERMTKHLGELAEVLSDTETAIAIDEGTFDPEVHDADFAAMFGVSIEEEDDFGFDDDLEEMEQRYGERHMQPIHGYGNQPNEMTYSVMHPLGISKVGQREKLVLAKQLPRETAEDEDLDGDSLDEGDTDDHFWDLR
jgi:hypothetical protein